MYEEAPRPWTVTTADVGRYCDLVGITEISDLEPGMDFRLPEYRREVFHRFYEFHLRHRAHPGCVYFLFPWLRAWFNWSDEETLWFAYINGCTQHPPTTLLIWKRFPRLDSLEFGELTDWFNSNFKRLGWDTDRRHQKGQFLDCVRNYRSIMREYPSQRECFESFLRDSNGMSPFKRLWEKVRRDFYSFGRLSAFSYLEYLRVMGIILDCDDLFLEDMAGSRSHRNGLAIVLGREDLDWHKSNPHFTGNYSDEQMAWLGREAVQLLVEARERAREKPWEHDVSYFTLESALCTYKSWHRPNRRYPGVYLDMLHDRIIQTQQRWPEERPYTDLFWQARKDCVPWYLLQEFVEGDPGLSPEKQNWYRLHGEVPVMGREDPVFWNGLDDGLFSELPVRGD